MTNRILDEFEPAAARVRPQLWKLMSGHYLGNTFLRALSWRTYAANQGLPRFRSVAMGEARKGPSS